MPEDRRVAKTKQAFLNAYVQLSKRKTPRKITVADLCREADVNRGTFYDHYRSLEDFLSWAEETVSQRLVDIFNSYQFDMVYDNFFDRLFSYITENADVIFTILDREGGPGLSDIYDAIFDSLIRQWAEKSCLPLGETRLLGAYAINGIFALLREWWRSGFETEEDMVRKLIADIGERGVFYFIF